MSVHCSCHAPAVSLKLFLLLCSLLCFLIMSMYGEPHAFAEGVDAQGMPKIKLTHLTFRNYLIQDLSICGMC